MGVWANLTVRKQARGEMGEGDGGGAGDGGKGLRQVRGIMRRPKPYWKE